MTIQTETGVLVYRFKENRLEVFLVPNNANQVEGKQEGWFIPKSALRIENDEIRIAVPLDDAAIQLEPIQLENGDIENVFAVEGELGGSNELQGFRDIQFKSIAGKSYFFPNVKSGTFFDVKEALKKVLPGQYEMLKELHEVLAARNLLKYI